MNEDEDTEEATEEQAPSNSNKIVVENSLGFLAGIIVLFWLFGIALSHGWWDTLWSICLPPLAMVITAEWLVGLINHLAGM